MGNKDLSRRRFFSQLVREGVKLILEIKKKKEESQRAAEVLASFDDYPIAGTYPRELFEEEAKKLGIDIDALGEKAAIKLIVEKKMFSKS